MRRTGYIFRLLLALFLMASLPLRGYAMGMLAPQVAQAAPAAEAANVYEPGTHEPGTRGHGTHGHGTRADASPDHAMHNPAMHAAAPQAHARMHAAHDHADNAQPAPPHHGNSSCGPCADCCTAGTLQSLPLAVQAPLAPRRVEARSPPSPASFIADLPVPPPNPLAA